MRAITLSVLLLSLAVPASRAAEDPDATTVRTEVYARQGAGEAYYYIYERGGRTICTKYDVYGRSGEVDKQYLSGTFKDSEDIDTGAPDKTTPAVVIPKGSLRKHVCLTKFGLISHQ